MALRDLTPDELTSYVRSNDPSLNDVDAPNVSVYDEKKDRVVSLPPTLDADETQFVIARDIEGHKDFFGQQQVTPETAWVDLKKRSLRDLAKGVGSFFAYTPQIKGGMDAEKGEGLVTGRESLNPLFYDFRFGPMDPQVIETDQDEQVRKAVGTALAADGYKLIEQNRKYMAKAGLEKPKDAVGGGILYDLGQGGGSLLASMGIAAFTRSPSMAALMFGGLQKSSIYVEAREAGVDPNTASFISTPAGVIEGVLEKVGLDRFMVALKGNSAVKRFVRGAMIEGIQEGSQQTAETSLTNATGIRDQDLQQAGGDILYSALLGSILGGGANATVGAFVKGEAKEQGFTEEQADKLAEYAEENIGLAKEDMGEFIRKEVAPVAADDARAMEFMTLMQKFDNNVDLVDPEALEPQQRAAFDQYVKFFNESVTNPTGIEAVEKKFFDMATEAGVPEDQAVAASKVMGARADAAARALGITPIEWYQRNSLEVEVVRPKEEAVEEYAEWLDDIRTAPAAEQSTAEMAEAETVDQETAVRGIEGRLRDIRESDKTGMKKPLLAWMKARGGVNPESTFAGELRHLGINSRTAPGLFRKGADTGEFDNFPAGEFQQEVGYQPGDDGHDYVDPEWLLQALRDEQFGKRLGDDEVPPETDDLFRRALSEAGLDYRTVTPEQVYEALGPDADIIVRAREFGEELTPKQARQVRAILAANEDMDLDDAIEEWAERASIMGEGTLYQRVDKTEAGDQNVLPGAERISDRQLAERKMEGKKRSTKEQKPMDVGMFGDESKQQTLFQRRLNPELRAMITEQIRENLRETVAAEPRIHDKPDFMARAAKGQLTPFERRTLSNFLIRQADSLASREAADTLNQEERGNITFRPDGALIRLFEHANASTLLHELGHLFLRDMAKVAKDSKRPRVKKDFETVKEWLGVKGNRFTEEQEEQFARGFEAYLREGKAPKPELNTVFERFKQWLESIYRSVKDLKVELSPEVREVFDRMLGLITPVPRSRPKPAT